MSIEPLNFSNNKYELTGNEQNTVTQKKDTINNVMNPDNRIVEDESYKTNSEADKEKTKSDEGEKLTRITLPNHKKKRTENSPLFLLF